MYIIKAENLTKRFGKFTALNNVNLEVKEGEIFGFIGPKWCREINDDPDFIRYVKSDWREGGYIWQGRLERCGRNP